MSSRKWKLRETDPEFFYFNIPDILTEIVRLYIREHEETLPVEVIKMVLRSPAYARLQNSVSGFWLKTPEELYREFSPLNSE